MGDQDLDKEDIFIEGGIEHQERRKVYRVQYPPEARPKLTIRSREFEVINLSERGIRFQVQKQIQSAEWVRGKVTFHDGESLEVEGKIIWKKPDEIALSLLIIPIPYERILKEQRYLINRFGKYPEEEENQE